MDVATKKVIMLLLAVRAFQSPRLPCVAHRPLNDVRCQLPGGRPLVPCRGLLEMIRSDLSPFLDDPLQIGIPLSIRLIQLIHNENVDEGDTFLEE